MQLPVPPQDVARAGLRGIKMVAAADGVFQELERDLMNAAQKHLLQTDFDLDELEPITPEELAKAIPPEFGERVLGGAIIVSLIDGEASAAETELLQAYAKAMGLKSDGIKEAQRLVDQQMLRFRMDVLRRSFLGQRMKDFVKRRGLRGLVTVAKGVMGREDPALAARYRALEQKPAGTLGRGYYDFVTSHEFSFPGEKDSAPEPIVFHDCLHVLAGYETTSLEETQIAAFQAGTMKKDPMFGLLFGLAQFQLGVAITPVTEAEKLVMDPDLLLAAFVRGTFVTRDVCVDWQPWDDFDRPIEELRTELNILPR